MKHLKKIARIIVKILENVRIILKFTTVRKTEQRMLAQLVCNKF